MVKYRYNTENNYHEFIYEGIISHKEIADAIINLLQKSNKNKSINILINAQNADYSKLKKQNPTQEARIIMYSSEFLRVRMAIVHTKKLETAISEIHQENLQRPGYEHEIFYSHEAALDWLLT